MCLICVQHEMGKLTDKEALRAAFEISMDLSATEHDKEVLQTLIELLKEKS